MNEDTWVAGKMLLSGWKIAYAADACVRHSHDYTMGEEFRRYFDIGVFHSREPWLMEAFGGAEGEGLRYLRSEFGFLWAHAPALIFSAICRAAVKYAGYRLGKLERYFGVDLKRRLSMHKRYWGQVR